ncbi:MAG: PIN domain-containing protein [Acidobacteria bacterium]|nr:PIN domain-containing protein [Acidobacteriota bacterium]
MNAHAKAFFDTNVLLYMLADADVRRRDVARQLFESCVDSRTIILSTQVVQEFYAAGSRKLSLPVRELRTVVGKLLTLPLVTLGPGEIRSALHFEERYGISFWDALIVAAAVSAGAGVLYTEDLNDGQLFGPVTVRNPFRAA